LAGISPDGQVAEQSIKTLLNPATSPDQIRGAAITLEKEALRIKRGEFREAFLTLVANSHAALDDPATAKRVAHMAAATHQEILAAEEARIITRLPVLGPLVAGKHTDWGKSLGKEMAAAREAGGNPLVAAAGKVKDLSPDVPIWIKIVCSLTMAAGTMAGGWRIIKTLGHKMVKLQPVHGFAAETTAATLLAVTGSFGMTVSTTHSVTTAIMGVGCAKRFNALKFTLIERIIWAWILTLPSAGIVAYAFVKLFRICGWIP
jgi:phosphate/sulfate permease